MKDLSPASRMDAIVLADGDTVATALRALGAGETVRLRRGGASVEHRVCEAIPFGHKFALFSIAQGDAVVKYGASIGTATAPIPAGGHVHIHNLTSARARPVAPR